MSHDQQEFLKEFEVPSFEEWRRAAESTLGGAPFEKKLITKTYENIDLQPIYTKADTEKLEYITKSLPGEYPYVRSNNVLGYKTNTWHIAQEINYPLPALFNASAKEDLVKGQSALRININSMFASQGKTAACCSTNTGCGLMIANISDMEKAFNGIDLTKTPVYFRPKYVGLEVTALFAAYCLKNKINLKEVKGSFGINPFAGLVSTGKACVAPSKALDDAAQAVKWASVNAPLMRVIAVDADEYHNGGASSVQDLTYAVATGVYFVKELLERGLNIDEIASSMSFNFSAGARFFTDIAKFRAARLIWARIIKEFGGNADAQKMFINASTSKVNKTKFDPYVNLLRVTSEAFGAITAGCDSLQVSTFDSNLGLPSDFARRIARNLQHLLKEEAHLTDTVDPVGGSWYIDTLTDQMARKAWDMFREIEKSGNILTALQKGVPQAAIAEVVKARTANLAVRKDVVLGTNKHPNLNEKPVDNLVVVTDEMTAKYAQESKASTKKDSKTDAAIKEFKKVNVIDKAESIEKAIIAFNAGADICDLFAAVNENCCELTIEAVKPFRSAEMFEELRLSAQAYKANTGSLPEVYLANFGLLKEYKGRADFSSDFFQVSGFDIVQSEGFTNPEEAAQKVAALKNKVVVICSTDDKYVEVVPVFAAKLKALQPDVKLVLAGLPKDYVETFRQAGVDEFIHVRSNIYEILSSLLRSMGVLA